jgi:hypothetical protein
VRNAGADSDRPARRLPGFPAGRVLTIAAKFRDLAGVFTVFAAELSERAAFWNLALACRVSAFF